MGTREIMDKGSKLDLQHPLEKRKRNICSVFLDN